MVTTQDSAGGQEESVRGEGVDRRATYLLIDPFDADAIRYIHAVFAATGLRPLCLYSDPKTRYYGERQFPILTSELIEASVDVDLGDPAGIIAQLEDRYDIRAAIPYREDIVEVVASLLPYLDVDWMEADALARFRDKHELKHHVSATDPSVRVPESRRVRTIADVETPAPPERFVLKPNSGMGSTLLGFFRAGEHEAIAAHIDAGGGIDWILEEFIDGGEYRVNGLIRRDGSVQILFIGEYLPTKIDEHFTLAYAAETQVPWTDPIVPELRDYTERLLHATGLRGSPFHLEVRVDEHGPAMVDLGARVGSEASALMLSQAHPGRPDVYSVATRDYFGPNEFASGPVDEEAAAGTTYVTITGVADQVGRIETIDGIAEVEAMPEFVSWSVKPAIGDPLRTMRELRCAPYFLVLRHDGDRQRSIELADRVRSTIRFNQGASVRTDLVSRTTEFVAKARRKGRWALHRALPRS